MIMWYSRWFWTNIKAIVILDVIDKLIITCYRLLQMIINMNKRSDVGESRGLCLCLCIINRSKKNLQGNKIMMDILKSSKMYITLVDYQILNVTFSQRNWYIFFNNITLQLAWGAYAMFDVTVVKPFQSFQSID